MSTLRELKEEMQFNTGLIGLLEIMKNIAVMEFHALQRKKRRFSRFLTTLKGFFDMPQLQNVRHRFINPGTDKLAVVIVTSDEGFMGGLNLQVINAAFSQSATGVEKLIVVGERGARYLKEAGKEFTAFSSRSIPDFGGREADSEQRARLALEVKNYIANGVKKGEFDRVLVSYPKAVSFMVQKVEVVKMLPIRTSEMGSRASRSTLHAPRYTQREAWSVEREAHDVIIESPIGDIIEYLAEEIILQRLIEIFEESKLSEFAARAIHLEKSDQQLAEKAKELKFRYFRAYHELIDKNTRELFSAQIIRRKQ